MKKIVYGASIRGNDHYISGKECQDAIAYGGSEKPDDIFVMALSDGHGGAPYCRSASGASMAVEIAKIEIETFLLEHRQLLDELDVLEEKIRFVDNSGQQECGNEIVGLKKDIFTKIEADFSTVKEKIWTEWKKRVDVDLEQNPATIFRVEMDTIKSMSTTESRKFLGYGTLEENEISFINNDLRESGVESVQKNPRQLYGATLLCIGNYKNHYFLVQIGDGDIVIIHADGSVDNPFAKMDGLVGGETYSLCQSSALSHFKERYYYGDVRFAMISTDGIVNSLENEGVLGNVAKWVYENLLATPADIKKEFKPFLREFSNGSGDDCSICFLANHLTDEQRDAFMESSGAEEVNDFGKLYVPKLTAYKFDFPEVEAKPKINGIYKFNELSKKMFGSCALMGEYKELAQIKRELMSPKKTLIGKQIETHFMESERALNEMQQKIYLEKMDEHLASSPVIIGHFKPIHIGLKERQLDVYEDDSFFGLVKAVNDRKISFERLEEEEYERMKERGPKIFHLEARIKISNEYAISIKENKINLIKIKE